MQSPFLAFLRNPSTHTHSYEPWKWFLFSIQYNDNKDALVGTLFILKIRINLLNFRKFHLIDMRLSNIRLCQYNLLQFYSNLEHSCKDMIRLYLYKSHFPKLNPCHIFFRLQSVFTCQNFVGHNLHIRHIKWNYIPQIRKLFLSIHFYLRSITQKV